MATKPPYPHRYRWGSKWVVVEEPTDGPVARIGGADLDEQDLRIGGDLEAWDEEARAWRRWKVACGTWRPAIPPAA